MSGKNPPFPRFHPPPIIFFLSTIPEFEIAFPRPMPDLTPIPKMTLCEA